MHHQRLGARIQEPGLKEISIFGKMHAVNARIERIEAFSGHADYKEMIDFISCQDKEILRKVFLVHGEHQTQLDFIEHLNKAGFSNVDAPAVGDAYDL